MIKSVRKITKTNYSHTITLPLEWIRTNNLKFGSNLEFDIRKDGTLIIRPQKDEG